MKRDEYELLNSLHAAEVTQDDEDRKFELKAIIKVLESQESRYTIHEGKDVGPQVIDLT